VYEDKSIIVYEDKSIYYEDKSIIECMKISLL